MLVNTRELVNDGRASRVDKHSYHLHLASSEHLLEQQGDSVYLVFIDGQDQD
ncbi:hypothetical protein K701_08675 [Streptomyces fradiae ATCC 10745 = DSM 40063]|uniref:Uncharacterized protein n=1 Tax=Streptomyces fradiae ATCC 10745 = DSM 40063 TaxID=1319510 RepID=A0ABQ6XWV9_STRFR|nr:hypothetical protein K701_08675 [Streptomyces fradiae ATCC 10745 = DSM 40063]